MGQGYSLTSLPAGSAGIDVAELSDLTFEKTLGSGRFMKSIRARHQDGVVFVKVAMKPYPSFKLDKYSKAIRKERKALANVPNALGYQRDLENGTNGYLVRQYHYSSLYDRLSTRPFLEDIEKKWLAFQLLSALRECHAKDVYHGDIKTENILVTSWNWLYLADFSSSFKPTFLPEDNPADFSYFFDNSGRRTCYLAPERFLLSGDKAPANSKINWAMDVFSAGCVIAELFVEAPIFSLSQLFKYRKGEYDPAHAHLSRIVDDDIRELVSHMIQVEPESRYPAEDYLNFWRRKAFPEYFYNFLHQYMENITDPSSGRAPVTSQKTNLGETDDRIERVYYDFDKISYFLGYESSNKTAEETESIDSKLPLPVCLDIPNNRHFASNQGPRPPDDGTLIFSTLIAASLRNTARASTRVRGCDLLLAFAEKLTDEAKLDRILPYIITLLNDSSDIVKIAAIRTLTQLLDLVRVVSPANAYVFPEYILRRLDPFVLSKDTAPSALVRATYASCLSTLANTALRFLDMIQALRADGTLPTTDPEAEVGFTTEVAHQIMYDSARVSLVNHFESHTKALLTDPDSSVRRAFLGSVSSLCVFFGTSKANDVILTHLNTYLNDKDWMLKCAFFETIIGVATFVGSTSLEEYILPLMVQALTDPEDFVVEKAIRSFATMAGLGLFQRSKIWELVDVIARFSMHPNIWIREAAAAYISSSTTYLDQADITCIIAPLVKPFFKTFISDYSELKLLDALKKPISRPVLDMASRWSLEADGSVFWQSAKKQQIFTLDPSSEWVPPSSSKDVHHERLKGALKNEKDKQWLSRLHNIGMAEDDEWKLLALQEYIWRMARSKSSALEEIANQDFNASLSLQALGIKLQTVLFDDDLTLNGSTGSKNDSAEEPSRSIADALLDASKSIDDPLARRKRSYANSRRAKENGRSSSTPARPGLESLRRNASESPSPSPSTIRGNSYESPDLSLPSSDNEDPSRLTMAPESNAQTSGTSTPDNATDPLSGPAKKSIRRKGSAVNLMNRKDLSKATAATATSSANANGTVDGTFNKHPLQHNPSGIIDELNGAQQLQMRHRPGNSYEGRDPNILKLLDQLSLENYPVEAIEFGPIINPLTRRQPIKRSSGQNTEQTWRPEGTLVAMFGEHTGPINRVAVSPDHAFFITASDDGSVKVWDTARLESNAAHRSRQSHKHANEAMVKSICFIEQTHCFASAATDGSIHVVRVDHQKNSNAARYGRLRLLRQYQLPSSEHVLWMEHFKSENHSILLFVTNKSRILALDLRTMTILYTIENPVHHGTPTCFCLDKRQNWLLLGTTHGILDFYDLRFRLRLKSWGLPGASSIHRLLLHPSRGRGRWVLVAGGTGQSEVTVWDVEKTQCREVYRTWQGGSALVPKDVAKNYEAWKPDDDAPETMLARFANSLEPAVSSSVDRGIRAMVAGTDGDESASGNPRGTGAFLLTGGSDRKIRFWDLQRLETSTVISGLDAEELKPSYTVSQPTATLTVAAEKVPPGGPTAENAGRGGRRTEGRTPRSTVISLQQQQLLRRHLDVITDIAVLESPYGMTVSVDRAGIVYIFS